MSLLEAGTASGRTPKEKASGICDCCFVLRRIDGPMLAPVETAALQAWNRRVEGLIEKPMTPIARLVDIRTEFTGAGTAEEAFRATAALYNRQIQNPYEKINLNFQSMADWSSAARLACSLNQDGCRFGDIMRVVPQRLERKLTESMTEKAGCQSCETYNILSCIVHCRQVRISRDELRSHLGLARKASAKAISKAVDGLFLKNGA